MTLNLNKIRLEKPQETAKISLSKGGGDARIILRWNKHPGGKQTGGGFLSRIFGGGANEEIDLDLGVCVELANGSKLILDPLQGYFQEGFHGSLSSEPYVLHSGDDRSGGGGEVLTISGSNSALVRQLWVYTFIYSGVARWMETDAAVEIQVPGQQPIEIPMGQQSSKETFCALAHIVLNDRELIVQRLISFHNSHESCDRRYGWGFNYTQGTK